MELNIIDLFTGIGGFSLGLHNADPRFKTIAFCEIDPFCQKVLQKNFPGVKIYDDIKDFKNTEPAFLVCGGFPCQGFSQAGLRRGTKDDRYLWGEMFAVIKQVKSKWIIAENVRGIVTTQDGLAFDTVHSDLESENYEVQAFNLPACGKGAWHRRERIFFIAYLSDSDSSGYRGRSGEECGTEQRKLQQKKQEGCEMGSETEGCSSSFRETKTLSDTNERDAQARCERQRRVREESEGERISSDAASIRETLSDSDVKRLEGYDEYRSSESIKGKKKSHTRTRNSSTKINVRNTKGAGFKSRIDGQRQEEPGGASPPGEQCQGDWSEIISQFRGVPDGVSTAVDRNRVNRLKALGNAVVPQVVEEIG